MGKSQIAGMHPSGHGRGAGRDADLPNDCSWGGWR